MLAVALCSHGLRSMIWPANGHPCHSGDPRISRDSFHRETWKSDLKGMATGKKKDPNEYARDHQSTPLSSLKDPDSFGPPPKHSAYQGGAASPSSPAQPPPPQGGWGASVPTPSRRQQQEEVVEEPPKPPEPYRANTTGLRTDNLPKPPVRRAAADGGAASPARTASPSLPPRQTPTLPAPQAMKPPPSLPPRMTENPTEYDPPPPPSYGEATKLPQDAATINQGAATRLSQAGVSVPGFGIGSEAQSQPPQASPAGPTGHGPQLSELQQRFSRMNTGTQASATSPASPTAAAAAAAKKAPPPPPPKKNGIGSRPSSSAGAPAPPPLPLNSKPRPGG